MSMMNQSLAPMRKFETVHLQENPELYDWCRKYLQDMRPQLHRYPEEEYTQVLEALAARTQWPKAGLFIGKSAPEALEFLIEVLITPGDSVAVAAEHPYAEVITRQVQIRQGICQPLEATSSPAPRLRFIHPELHELPEQPEGSPVITITLNPTQLVPRPDVVHLFEWRHEPASLNSLPGVFGFCANPDLVSVVRNVQEPFHIPTQILQRMLDTVQTMAQDVNHVDGAPSLVSSSLDAHNLHTAITSIQPYVPGKGIKTMARELGMAASAFSKLASNEHPFGIPDEVLQEARRILSEWEATPPTYTAVRERFQRNILQLAGCPPIAPEHVLVGTGSVELIKSVLKAFVPVDTDPHALSVLFPQMPFAMYPFETRKRLATFNTTELDDQHQLSQQAFIEAIQTRHPRVIFLANPRNPLGTALDNLTPIIEALSDEQVLVLDEAYVDFIRAEMGEDRYPDGVGLLQAHPDKNLVVLRTFSKGHALASFRLGYGFTHPRLAERIQSVMLPCAVDPLSMAVGIAALETPSMETSLRETVAFVLQEKKRFYAVFEELGLRYIPSYANFVYFETGERYTGKSLFDTLSKQGVIIRPILEGSARVNVGTKKENEHFFQALRQAYA